MPTYVGTQDNDIQAYVTMHANMLAYQNDMPTYISIIINIYMNMLTHGAKIGITK